MRWPWHHKKKKRNIAAVPQTIQGIQLQSSAVGTAIPLVYGQARVASRLIHYKKLILAAGGGGLPAGSDDPNNSAIAMAICEGPIAGVLKAFEDKDQTDQVVDNFTQAGGDFVPGTTTSLTLRNAPVPGTVSLLFPRSGLAIAAVVGSVVNFTGAIPLGTQGVVLQYQTTGGLAARGFVIFLGTLAQAAWSYLTTNYPAEAVPYELTAYVANPSWPTPNQQLPNYSWEVQALLQWGSGIVDANPKDVINDFLTDANHGVGFPSAQIASLTTFRDYCTATGIFLSPVFDTQRPAAEILQELQALANSSFVWSDGQLKIVPYGDQAITGNGVTFTPNTTPVYNLTDDDFIAEDGDDPVHLVRRPQSDVYNMVQVEFDNRANQYNGDIAEAKDQNSIELYGLKPAPVIKAPYVKDAAVARLVAQLAVQRQVYIRNTYEFTLPMRYVLLEPMDLVALTDSNLGLSQTPVRLLEIDENEDGTFACTAEEAPPGVSTAVPYSAPVSGPAPTPTAIDKPPKRPEISGSYNSRLGFFVLNISGDSSTVKHIFQTRTDRLPTLAETRAGTVVASAGQAGINVLASVAPGDSVYVGALAYTSSGAESPLAQAIFTREGLDVDSLGRMKRALPLDDGKFAPRASDAAGTIVDSTVTESGGKAVNRLLGKVLPADPDSLDGTPEGTTFKRVIGTAVDASTSKIDFTKTGFLGKNGDNVGRSAGDATAVSTIVQNVTNAGHAGSGMQESGGKAINRLLGKALAADPDNLDGAPDGTTYKRIVSVVSGQITPSSSSSRNRCKVSNSANQSIGDSTITKVNFNTEVYDDGGLHDTSVNNERITVPTGGDIGEWRLVASIEFAANATGRREIYLTKNGITLESKRVAAFSAGGFGPRDQIVAVDDTPAVGDFYDVRVFQNSGGALNVLSGSTFAGKHEW